MRIVLKFTALLALLLPVGYGLFIEPHWVDVTRWQRQVGLGGKTFKIVQLSDLHISKIGKTEKQTLSNLKELKPDLILMTGDVIDQKNSLPALDAYLKQLPPAIKVAILGNWEYWSDVNLKSLATLYKENDVTLLVNDCLSLADKGIRLSIAGLDDYTAGMPDLAKTFMNCGKDEPVVLAEHSPGVFDESPLPGLGKIAFNLAGHTHGGQLAIGGKAMFTPRGSGRYVAGWYKTAWGDLYVSRGVGTSIIPLRIGARPEIVLLEIN
jgi:predicted MPP superfamily phosphohydrolase